MPYGSEEMEHVRGRIKELFAIATELENTFPGRKFTLDGHLVGSIGEVIAAYFYDLELLRNSFEKHDARASSGTLVQIKATQGSHGVALRSCPEHLIVLWIDDLNGEAYEVYNGPGATVWDACRKMASNGTQTVSMTKIGSLAAVVKPNQRIESVHPIARK